MDAYNSVKETPTTKNNTQTNPTMCAKKSPSTTKKQRKSKPAKDPKAPKKPLSSYMLFCQAQRETVKSEMPELNAKEILSELGKRWQALTDEEKVPFIEEAGRVKAAYAIEKKEYDEKNPPLEESPKKKKKRSRKSSDDDESPKKKKKTSVPKKKKKQSSDEEVSDHQDDDEASSIDYDEE
jgi:hypothetical protein